VNNNKRHIFAVKTLLLGLKKIKNNILMHMSKIKWIFPNLVIMRDQELGVGH
jgi:hypothetical protein